MRIHHTVVSAVLLVSGTALRAQPPASQAPPSPAGPTAAKPAIDPRAMELLKQNQETMATLQTFQAECRTTLTRDKALPNSPATLYQITTVREARPNVMRWEWWFYSKPTGPIETQQRSGAPDVVIVVDGSRRVTEIAKAYSEEPTPATEKIHTGTEPWGGFFTTRFSPYGNAIDESGLTDLREARIDGKAVVDGVDCTKIYVRTLDRFKKVNATSETTYYIGSDHIVRRSTSYFKMGSDPGLSYDNRIVSIKLNAPIAAEEFAYKPAPGVKPYRITKNDPSLLHVGSLAPEFSAVDLKGKTIKLSDFRGQSVLVDFWGAWCHSCVSAMPDNQTVISRLQASGSPVVMLAVDDSDDRPDFDKWIKSERSAYPALNFVYAASDMSISVKQYKVNGFPTQYLIDKDGVIRATFVGADEQLDEQLDDLVSTIKAALKSSNSNPR